MVLYITMRITFYSFRFFTSIVAALTVLIVVMLSAGGVQAADDVTWVEEDFESAAWHKGSTWNNWLGSYITSSSTEGISGNGTEIMMYKGRHEAAMLDYQFSEHGYRQPDEAYFRYWVKFDRVPPSTGKLPGFMGLYSNSARGGIPPSVSRPGWSARVEFGPAPGGGSDTIGIGYYTYSLDQPGANGEGLWWDTTLNVGSWTCIEGRVAMNTPGRPDGELEAWVDGTHVFAQDDLLFRSSTQTGVHVREFMFEVYYGGSATPPVNIGVSFDNLVLADHKIGCQTPVTGTSFEDTINSPFKGDIAWLADVGVTKGCNPTANTRFCPDARVTRGQMAAFLHRALGDLVPTPPQAPLPDNPPTMWGVEVTDYAGALETMTAVTGHAPDLIHVEYPLDGKDWLKTGPGNPSWWVPMQLTNINEAGSTAFVEFYVNDIAGFNAGRYDKEFNAWVATITGWTSADPANNLLIAPFGGSNNERVAWGGNPTASIAAYRKVHNAVRAAGAGPEDIRFVYQVADMLYSSKYNSTQHGNGYSLYSPGRSYIDLMGISTTNDGTRIWETWDNTYKSFVVEIEKTVGPDIPVLFAMISSDINDSSGNTRAAWFAQLAEGITESETALGFVYMDKNRDLPYEVGSSTKPEPGFLQAIAILDSPANSLEWVFSDDLDTWAKARRATSQQAIFSDDDGSVFETDIAWLAATGITKGCAAGRFCPDSSVTRGQMAAFLHRALGDIVHPTRDVPAFTDISESVFKADIEWLAATGITRGCGVNKFCPDSAVTRGQMAAFLHRALGDLL